MDIDRQTSTTAGKTNEVVTREFLNKKCLDVTFNLEGTGKLENIFIELTDFHKQIIVRVVKALIKLLLLFTHYQIISKVWFKIKFVQWVVLTMEMVCHTKSESEMATLNILILNIFFIRFRALYTLLLKILGQCLWYSGYKALENIGIGAYGVVCSAVSEKTGAAVAIKKITSIFDDTRVAKRTYRLDVKVINEFSF